MISRILAALSFTLLFCAGPAYANLATTAKVYLKGEPGSWVSGAVGSPEATWTHGIEGIFSATTNFDKGVSVSYQDGNYWSFDFAAPTYDPITNTNDGQPLGVGLYNKATRFPFNSPTKPGINISGNGRGNNQQSGWFNVLEISYGLNGINAFAVDFRQYDESLTQTGPSLYGSLRFNSSIPLTPVPEPSGALLLAAGLLVVLSRSAAKLR